MVQSCCGTACDKAGGKMIRGMSNLRSVSIDGRGSVLLKDANGTIIESAGIGPPLEVVAAQEDKRQSQPFKARAILHKRGCTGKSWHGGEVLTRPSPNVTIVANSVAGGTAGSTVQITTERSESYSSTVNLGITDIISLGVSAEFTQSYSTSKAVTVGFLARQSGKLGFTATMYCRTGKGQCDNGEVEGEIRCKSAKGPCEIKL
jgi:hypothetical protein